MHQDFIISNHPILHESSQTKSQIHLIQAANIFEIKKKKKKKKKGNVRRQNRHFLISSGDEENISVFTERDT